MKGRPPARIRVGIGGWTYAPWRGSFYPADLPQARELEYASRTLTSIEINGTFYRLQKPSTYARWRDATPDDFVFALKAPRYITHRRALVEAGPAIERFLASGVEELGAKLGPINWQLPPTKRFDPDDLAAFLALLPRTVGGCALRHAVELRHASFAVPGVVDLLREHGVAAVLAQHPDYPLIADLTAPFVYVRLQACAEAEPEGYAPAALGEWATRARAWAAGRAVDELEPIGARAGTSRRPREVFVYFINGFKPRAPAAAMALLRRLAAD